MQEELRRSNTIGDSQGIRYFVGIALKDEVIKITAVRQICSFVKDVRLNFNSILAFFEYLGLICVSSDSIVPTEAGRYLYAQLRDGFEEMLCEICINRVIEDSILDLTALRFDIELGRYYIQKHGFPISAAIFRNVLIQLHALRILSDGSLELDNNYEALFMNVQNPIKRKISMEALKNKLEQQEIQGEKAEEFILIYEQGRLAGSELVSCIKRISVIDVAAGYDIVSFESVTSSVYDRLIEVKCYCGQPHFYWSKNEIGVAKLNGDKYYLYLVDAKRIGTVGYTPTIIKNPAKAVIEVDGWLMTPESYLVQPLAES